MRDLLRWTVALAALAAVGCIDYQETIRVRADGSAEVSVYATVLDAAVPMIRNRPELRQLLLLPTSAKAARQGLPQDVGIKYWSVEQGPGIRIFDAAVTIPTIDRFGPELGGFLAGQNFQIFLDDDGTIQYRREVPAVGMQDRGALFSGFEDRLSNSNLEFHLIVPTRIAETNGVRIGDDEVMWRTNLLDLRRQGLLMVAKVEAPGLFARMPWLPPLLLATIVAAMLVVLRRRRSRGAVETAPPME